MTTKTKTKPARPKAAKAKPAVPAWDVHARGRCVHRSDKACSICLSLQEMIEKSEALLDGIDHCSDLVDVCSDGVAEARMRTLRGEISEAKRQLARS